MSTYRALGPAHAPWRTSTYSGNTGNCVQVAELAGGHRAVRDSKHPAGPTLLVPPVGWTAFTAGLRSGHFG